MKHHPKPVLRLMGAICLCAFLVTSCTTSDAPGYGSTPPADPDVTTTPQASPTATQDETTTQPVGDFTTERYESENWPASGQAQGVYPTTLRSASHDGFERVVIEHAGTGTPSMLVQYTTDPVAPGSGQPIDMAADAVLEIIWSGTASIDDIDENRLMQVNTPITELDTTAVQSVVVFAPWEATSSYFIGLDEQRPYAVTILQDPVRLVVDIETD